MEDSRVRSRMAGLMLGDVHPACGGLHLLCGCFCSIQNGGFRAASRRSSAFDGSGRNGAIIALAAPTTHLPPCRRECLFPTPPQAPLAIQGQILRIRRISDPAGQVPTHLTFAAQAKRGWSRSTQHSSPPFQNFASLPLRPGRCHPSPRGRWPPERGTSNPG